MKILNLHLDDDEKPDLISVEMTRAEALLLVNHVGDLMPSTKTSTGIWNALTGTVFNLYWDDGVSEATRLERQRESGDGL